jgi:hypothetical protein
VKIKTIIDTQPILLIAPHGGGPTDLRTAEMTEVLADKTSACAVINTGWKRPWTGNGEGTNKTWPHAKLDIKNGIANLNNLTHCRKKPLDTDFLGMIERCKKLILGQYPKVYIYLIHGMDDTIRVYNGVNMILGTGEGNPARISCSSIFKERLAASLAIEKFTPAIGKAGGRLSAWDNNNLNQLYQTENRVESVQIEIALTLRDTDKRATDTAERLANVINRVHSKQSIPFLRHIPER